MSSQAAAFNQRYLYLVVRSRSNESLFHISLISFASVFRVTAQIVFSGTGAGGRKRRLRHGRHSIASTDSLLTKTLIKMDRVTDQNKWYGVNVIVGNDFLMLILGFMKVKKGERNIVTGEKLTSEKGRPLNSRYHHGTHLTRLQESSRSSSTRADRSNINQDNPSMIRSRSPYKVLFTVGSQI